MADGLCYRVCFTIGPIEDASTAGLRVAELVAILKRDTDTDVRVQIRPFAFGDDEDED